MTHSGIGMEKNRECRFARLYADRGLLQSCFWGQYQSNLIFETFTMCFLQNNERVLHIKSGLSDGFQFTLAAGRLVAVYAN